MVNQHPGDRGRGSGTPPGSAGSRKISQTPIDESVEAKRRLEALFSGGKPQAAPQAAAPRAEPVFSSPRRSIGRTPSEYRLRLERLRMAREVPEIQEAADAFLSHHQLPDDVDILYKVLQHPTEKIAREALGQLSSLLMQGRLSTTVLLEDRLNSLADRATESATRSYIDGMRAQLASLKKT